MATGQLLDGTKQPRVTTDAGGGMRPENVLYGPDGNPLLPAAVALAEGLANPTVSEIGACELIWNGATWDRGRSPGGDAQAVAGIRAVAPMGFNGSGYDRLRADANRNLMVSLRDHSGNEPLINRPAFSLPPMNFRPTSSPMKRS